MRTWGMIIAFGCAWGALAQTPIATISSGESFEVDGVKVPVAGLPSWPLMAGDIIATGKGPAVISFGNRGRVVLDKNSKLQLQSGPGRPSVHLLHGALSVKAERGSGLRVTALDRTIQPAAGTELAVAVDGTNVLTGSDVSSLDRQKAAYLSSAAAAPAAAKPKPSPTPTPTPPPPPSPK